MNQERISADCSKQTFTAEGKEIDVYRKQFFFHPDKDSMYLKPDTSKRVFAAVTLNEVINQILKNPEEKEYCQNQDFYFYGTGWQSWGYGGETAPGKYEKPYTALIPPLKKYITMPGDSENITTREKKLLTGQFIMYVRWNDIYIVLASTGNVRKDKKTDVLPPVEYTISRKKRILTLSVDAVGKMWTENELMAEISVFAVHSYFELKSVISQLYSSDDDERLSHYKPLSIFNRKIVAAGWESWYNHYNKINKEIISEDLNALGTTDNLINRYASPKTDNVIFQVDDGWQIAAGQWDVNTARFPEGMKKLADDIRAKNYIPGLWIAPFVIDLRTDFARQHDSWILKDDSDKPLAAGFNVSWGSACGKDQPGFPHSFYCLDLSRKDVVDYLDSLMEKIINQWGFRYIKIDFLYAGMLNGKFTEDGAAYIFYNRAIETLTRRKINNRGEQVWYLGCGCPFELSFNCFPLSRIGSDTKEDWDYNVMRILNFSGRPGAFINMISTLGHSFWDQSIFINDPDVVFLRNTNTSLTDIEKELIALVNFLFAGQLMHSDDPCHFDLITEGEFTKHIMDLYNLFEDEEFGLKNITGETYYIFTRSKKYCGLLNLSEGVIEFTEKDILEAAGIDTSEKTKLIPVVKHLTDDGRVMEHSILIYRSEN